MEFDYFYNRDGDRFSYYMLPKIIVTDDLDGYYVIDPLDVERFDELIFKRGKTTLSDPEQRSMERCLRTSVKRYKELREEKQREYLTKLRNFKRFYEYLIQVSCFEDPDVHKFYIYITYFLKLLSIDDAGDGFDLRGKVKIDRIQQIKGETRENEPITPEPFVSLPVAEPIVLPGDKRELLSEIIAEINAKTGADYDVDLAINAAMQIRAIMMKSDDLKTSAKNNTESDFKFSYFSNVEDALIQGLGQNQGFFSYLLDHPEVQKDVLGIFLSEIYKSLRASGE